MRAAIGGTDPPVPPSAGTRVGNSKCPRDGAGGTGEGSSDKKQAAATSWQSCCTNSLLGSEGLPSPTPRKKINKSISSPFSLIGPQGSDTEPKSCPASGGGGGEVLAAPQEWGQSRGTRFSLGGGWFFRRSGGSCCSTLPLGARPPPAPTPPTPSIHPRHRGVGSPARGRAGTRLFVIFTEQILIKSNT